jgi:hypothetical protein
MSKGRWSRTRLGQRTRAGRQQAADVAAPFIRATRAKQVENDLWIFQIYQTKACRYFIEAISDKLSLIGAVDTGSLERRRSTMRIGSVKKWNFGS